MTTASTSTSTKSYDFTQQPEDSSDSVAQMQITSKKVIPTALGTLGSTINDQLSSGNYDFSAFSATRTPETIITLELPNELTMSSEFDWSFQERNFLESLVGDTNSNKTRDAIDKSPESVLYGLAQRIGVAATSAFGGDIVFKNAGYAVIPLKEIFFNGNGNRTFSWSWDLFAKDETESNNIMDLCDRLREQVHPTSQNMGIVQIPNEFEVEWINCNLPKISTCACTSFDTDYSAGGAPRFFTNGNPAFVRLSMTFTEIEILTRNKLEKMRSK